MPSSQIAGINLLVRKPSFTSGMKFTPLSSILDSLIAVGERLIGPFNIEAVVEPIDLQISDAFLNFLVSGYEVTQKIIADIFTCKCQFFKILCLCEYLNVKLYRSSKIVASHV